MALHLADYIDARIEVDEETEGGDTFYVNSKALCYGYTSSHHRAVRALTNNHTIDYMKIKQSLVESLIDRKKISVDVSMCSEETGWLGIKVYDEIDDFIGEVGTRCAQLAGRGTEHKGSGRCKFHDGAKKVAGIRTGRFAKVSKKSLQQKVELFLLDEDATSLHKELATQRALMQVMVDWVTDEATTENTPDIIEKTIKLYDIIGRQAERMSAIEQRHALTAGQVMYLQVVVADILKTYIEDPRKLEKATYDLAERLGFSVAQNESKTIMAVNTDW